MFVSFSESSDDDDSDLELYELLCQQSREKCPLFPHTVHAVFFGGMTDLPVLVVYVTAADDDEDGKGFLGGGLGMFVF